MQLPQKWQAGRPIRGTLRVDLHAELRRPLLDDPVTAFHWDRRQEYTVWEVLQAVEIPTNTDFPLNAVIERGDVFVVEWKVLAGAIVVILASEVALAEPPGNGIPEHRFAAQASSPLTVKALLARLHGGDLPVCELVGHGVCVEVGARVDPRSAFHDGNLGSRPRQMRRNRSAACSRPNHHDVIDLACHSWSFYMRLGTRQSAAARRTVEKRSLLTCSFAVLRRSFFVAA
jgi:hypothetical protein